jgi:competence protein ComEA
VPTNLEPTARSPGLAALADRLGITPASALAGTLAIIAAAGAAWWALRAPDPPPIESVLPAAGTVTVATPPPTSTDPTPLVVHVDGEVIRPGVHELDDGARVVDAVAAAGGLTDNADRERINLAARVSDGERLWIPALGQVEPTVVAGRGGGAGTAGGSGDIPGPIDLNQADEAQLQELPGIGPALAAAIVEHRIDHGPFRSVDELLDVTGIGPSKLAQLRDLAVV